MSFFKESWVSSRTIYVQENSNDSISDQKKNLYKEVDVD